MQSCAVDVPVAWFESKAQAIRSDAAARAKFTGNAVQVATKELTEDEELVKRATLFLGARMLKEQKQRESVTREALDDLRTNPPETDATAEIDEDWLDVFARLVESRSDATVQTPNLDAQIARTLANRRGRARLPVAKGARSDTCQLVRLGRVHSEGDRPRDRDGEAERQSPRIGVSGVQPGGVGTPAGWSWTPRSP